MEQFLKSNDLYVPATFFFLLFKIFYLYESIFLLFYELKIGTLIQ